MKTEIGRNSTSNWSSGPIWLRQRSLGKNKLQRMRTSHDLVKRLRLEATLEEIDNTYNYFHMDWNQKGTLLAIGQHDPYIVGIWEVFKKRELCKEDTGWYWGYVSCVKFVPNDDTQIVVSRSSGGLRIVDIVTGESSRLSGDSCHIAVHSSEPNLIWSVTRDGYVICCDLRQYESLAYKYEYRSARRMAINPLRSEVLAVGLLDGDTRLIDKRALKSGPSSSCIAHFAPFYQNDHKLRHFESLAFNSDGSELLVSIQGEQVYLFNTYEPWEKYRSFELSIKPFLSAGAESIDPSTCSKLKPYSYLRELRKQCPVEMHDELKALCHDVLTRDSTLKLPINIIDHINESPEERLQGESGLCQQVSSLQDNDIIDYLNVLLDKVKNCPDLYRARAIALMRRSHLGDYHQALRDCYCALLLKPLDFRTIRCLSSTLIKLENAEDVCRLLDFVEDAIKEFGDHDDLAKSRETLQAFKEMKENESVRDVDRSATSDSESSHSELSHSESAHHIEADPTKEFDYNRRFNSAKEVFRCYEANFFGSNDEFIIGGTDTAFHVWDKNTTNIVNSVNANDVRFVLPHPTICMVATSGPGDAVKLWSPIGKESQDADD